MKKNDYEYLLKFLTNMEQELKTILLASIILLLPSCSKNKIKPSAEVVTKSYSFNKIKSITAASSVIIVYYFQGNATSIKVEGPANMVEALCVKTDASNKLMIELEDSDIFDITSNSQFIKVWISSPSVNSFEVMGGASMIVLDPICSPTTVTIDAYTGSKAFFSDIKSKHIKAYAFQDSKISINRVQASYIEATPYTGATIIISGDTIKP